MLGQNHFAEPNRHVLTFLGPIFSCWATYSEPVWSCSDQAQWASPTFFHNT
jgi:hypothetical protein